MTTTEDKILSIIRSSGPITAVDIVSVYERTYGYISPDKVYYYLGRLESKSLVQRKGVQPKALRWGRDPVLYEAVA